MTTAFVMLKTKRGEVAATAEELMNVEGVTEVYSITGDYDLIAVVRVKSPEEVADVVTGRAMPGATDGAAAATAPPLLNIASGTSPPADSFVAVPYKGRWFWIADTDIRSKLIFGSVMLLFSISDVGVRSAPPVVTVPAN